MPINVLSPVELEREVRRFVADNFMFAEDAGTLAGADSLTRSGLIDSTGVLELVFHLEETFGIQVADEETIPDNLDSIDNIVRYLSNKLVQNGKPADAE